MVADLQNRPSQSELQQRAQNIRLVVSDNDGVLTDGTVFVSEKGEELKQYSLRDGMGVQRLRESGVDTAILTREKSQFANRRAEKLKLKYCWTGVQDKKAALTGILEQSGWSVSQLAYIGDDVNDLGIMKEIGSLGLSACPSDAIEMVQKEAHFIAPKEGGKGAFREFAEWILDLRNAIQPKE